MPHSEESFLPQGSAMFPTLCCCAHFHSAPSFNSSSKYLINTLKWKNLFHVLSFPEVHSNGMLYSSHRHNRKYEQRSFKHEWHDCAHPAAPPQVEKHHCCHVMISHVSSENPLLVPRLLAIFPSLTHQSLLRKCLGDGVWE